MTTRTFAAWVEPIAAELRASRAEIARTAQKLLPEHWTMPSPLPGWTYKDVLAHLAVGDWVCQSILGAVVANKPADLSILGQLNDRNEQYRRERVERTVEDLITELAAESEETQELLSKLSDGDEGRKQEDAPMSLGEYLRIFPDHDRGHLGELRTALDNVML
jgi:uncharacterized protein (TIGR03083 family)